VLEDCIRFVLRGLSHTVHRQRFTGLCPRGLSGFAVNSEDESPDNPEVLQALLDWANRARRGAIVLSVCFSCLRPVLRVDLLGPCLDCGAARRSRPPDLSEYPRLIVLTSPRCWTSTNPMQKSSSTVVLALQYRVQWYPYNPRHCDCGKQTDRHRGKV
jgi:hypothetical protein